MFRARVELFNALKEANLNLISRAYRFRASREQLAWVFSLGKCSMWQGYFQHRGTVFCIARRMALFLESEIVPAISPFPSAKGEVSGPLCFRLLLIQAP